MDPERFITHGHIYMDLVAIAFACDLTRVATVNWTSYNMPTELGFNLHDVSHGGDTLRNKASTWMTGYFAGFIDRLKNSQDGPGSVWDNTIFYWTTEIGTGNHNLSRQPCLVAGSGSGYFKTNQRIVLPWQVEGRNINKDATGYGDLYVSFLNAMGVPATTFGAPEFCKGALAQLVA